MLPECGLDEQGLQAQRERYEAAGRGARVVERERRRLIVELAPSVDRDLVAELVAVERQCCPFFAIAWDARARRLSVAVSDDGHEAALRQIAAALGLPKPAA
jgi:hypothetical protein